MNKLLVAALIAASFISFEARAQERAGSAALGAVSGAVVLGPLGAVAGAFIGYSAGPAIAHSWGVGRSASRQRSRRESRADAGAPEVGVHQQAAARINPPSPAKPPEKPTNAKAAAPPVQGFE
jgi:hypothetical protein